jgi:pyruvate dehydrogenase E2 component (dihydrolipoamide acetyltransferase)
MKEIKMPEAGFNITEGKIVKWNKKVGDKVEEGEDIVSVETDKITVDIPAVAAGVLQEIFSYEGDMVPVGNVLGIIVEKEELISTNQKKTEDKIRTPKSDERESTQLATTNTKKSDAEVKKISPLAKALAKKEGIDLSLITSGTGSRGMIVKEDIINIIDMERTEVVPSIDTNKQGVRVEFTGWRKVIADRVTKSYQEVPQCTVTIEVDITELSELIPSIREKEGIRITYIPFIMKAIIGGHELVPEINAYTDSKSYTILDEVNIGVVVNVEGKLLIPVVKAVKEKRLFEIAQELNDLFEKAVNNKLEKEDIDGGTITITNVGPYQIHTSTALILQPQTAIVQMEVAKEVAAVRNGNVEVRKLMNIGVTYDHRVLDGALCGKFLMKVKSCIENPYLSLINFK